MKIDIAGATRPRPDQAVGGDWTYINQHDDAVWLACIDVLGHGVSAYEVTVKLSRHFEYLEQFSLLCLMTELNDLLRGGLGAAISLCYIDLNSGLMDYVGIGNVATRKLSPTSTTLVSRDGVVGEMKAQPQLQQVQLAIGDIYLLHTDGVKTRFDISQYRHIISDSASRASNHILQNFAKHHDDAGCIVIKVLQ